MNAPLYSCVSAALPARRAARTGAHWKPRRTWLLLLALCLCACPVSAQAQTSQTSPAGQGNDINAKSLLDSLTHGPGAQDKPGQGFSKKSAVSGAQTGPTAPTSPKAPVVPGVKAQPTGSQPPLPGSAFPTAPANQQPVQPAKPLTKQPSKASAPKPASQAERPRETVLTLEFEGRERLAVVYAPRHKGQKKGQSVPRLPLVIFLHGAGGSASQAARQTGLAALSERAGFIAVFPEGLSGPPGSSAQGGQGNGQGTGQDNGGIQTWNAWNCCGYARDQRVDDVGYLAALIARLKADYPVDPRRIHLAGFSNGAMLASRFALERPGVIASIASVAGYLPCDAQDPAEPLPVLVIHGNCDRVARFGPTEAHPRTGRFCEDFPAKAQVEFWVRTMGLAPKAQQVQDGRKSRVRVERYGPGKKAGRGLVEFVIVKGGGHAWPGGPRERYRYCDAPTPDPDATALIWEFFKRQARPGPAEKAEKPQKSAKKPAKGKARG